MTNRTFLVTEPTRAFLDYMGQEREVTLAPGTRLQYAGPNGFGDPCSDIYMDWDEFVPLDGPWVGQLVVIEDADTPRDSLASHGYGPHFGSRRRLGPPDSVVAEEPLPPDWTWQSVG